MNLEQDDRVRQHVVGICLRLDLDRRCFAEPQIAYVRRGSVYCPMRKRNRSATGANPPLAQVLPNVPLSHRFAYSPRVSRTCVLALL